MKSPLVLLMATVCFHTQADEQKFHYKYDDSTAEYSVVSTVEIESGTRAIVKRAGAFFTTYTKLQIDCAGKTVRQTGSYNSVDRLESVELDEMQGSIVDGSIAGEVGKIVCQDETLSASEAKKKPAA